MQVIGKPAMAFKVVNWHGIELHIPSDHVAVAADSDGWVYSYPTVPKPAGFMDAWMSGGYFDLCQVDLEGMPWRETVVEYPL